MFFLYCVRCSISRPFTLPGLRTLTSLARCANQNEGFGFIVGERDKSWLEYFYHEKQLHLLWGTLLFLWGLAWKLRKLTRRI
ncbi:hypothetical protein [Candidatus Venteria ishoeyi]|uniref:hypothetical protein n=1 Tax=Candidatus Venteria ishoeyi TaxID=1899563 RepID=UPI0025A5FF2E|nr:hypothetical protein [Candidatus Venteria ishoeyi]